MKISTFKQQSNINESLIDAVINQMGGKREFKDAAPSIAAHGIDGGFGGFIYHTDTVEFAKSNKSEIMELAENMAEEIGLSGALELIAGFNCLNGDYSQSEISAAIYSDTDDSTQVLNALSWFAAEEVAGSYEWAIEA